MIADLTSVEVCRLTGVTARQLQWWTDTGLIRPKSIARDDVSGQVRRFWPRSEIRKIRLIASVPPAVRHAKSFMDLLSAPGFRYVLLAARPFGNNGSTWHAETVLRTNSRTKVLRAAAAAASAVYLIDLGVAA